MHNSNSAAISKVPEITLAFWVIKILATTLGRRGDAVSMSMELGYLVSTAIFAVIFFVSVSAQIAATSYNPSFTGPPSSPPPRSAPPWQTLPIARSGWVMPVVPRCCWPC